MLGCVCIICLDLYSLLGNVKKYQCMFAQVSTKAKGQKGTEVEMFAVTLTKCTG